jgi:hypothetical protein
MSGTLNTRSPAGVSLGDDGDGRGFSTERESIGEVDIVRPLEPEHRLVADDLPVEVKDVESTVGIVLARAEDEAPRGGRRG